jgi:hypothetical protein
MKGNKGEDKLTIKKSAHPGIDFFFSLCHVIAEWRISSTTALHQLTLGKSETSIVMKASFPLTLLSTAGNNNLLNAATTNILTTKSLLISSFDISCKSCYRCARRCSSLPTLRFAELKQAAAGLEPKLRAPRALTSATARPLAARAPPSRCRHTPRVNSPALMPCRAHAPRLH